MCRPYQILLPLFSLFLVRVDLTDLNPVIFEVEIVEIYDGDTVLVRRGAFETKVRLAKIDAPEKSQGFATGEPGAGKLSKKCLEQSLSRKAELSIDGVDIYGRILGDLSQVSLKLIQKGCVAIYPYAKFESQKQKYDYLRELVLAKKFKKGLWAFGGIEQPKAWRKKNKKSFRKRT